MKWKYRRAKDAYEDLLDTDQHLTLPTEPEWRQVNFSLKIQYQ